MDGHLLERQYRDYLSGYFDWEERPHAGKWLVFSMLMRFFLGYYYMYNIQHQFVWFFKFLSCIFVIA